MKRSLKFIAVLLIGAQLFYTACKKSNNNNKTTPVVTLGPKQVSSLVALNITATLFNGFGIWSMENGLTTISAISAVHNKHVLNSTSLCGFVNDTALNYTSALGDTGKVSVTGDITYTYLCTNGGNNGNSQVVTLSISETGPKFSVSHKLNENITEQGIPPLNESSYLYLNGTLADSSSYQYKTGAKQNTSEQFSFTFSQLPINPNSPEYIESGTATFSTSGSNLSGTWNYKGTIAFVTNSEVNITINGTTYNVDLATGIVN
jgi:hypothetical protein